MNDQQNNYTSISLTTTIRDAVKEYLETKDLTIPEFLNTLGDSKLTKLEKDQYLHSVAAYNKTSHITLLEKNDGNIFPKIFHYIGDFKILWFNHTLLNPYKAGHYDFKFLIKLEDQKIAYIEHNNLFFSHEYREDFTFNLRNVSSIKIFENLNDFGSSDITSEGFESVKEISKAYYTDYKSYEDIQVLDNDTAIILKEY